MNSKFMMVFSFADGKHKFNWIIWIPTEISVSDIIILSIFEHFQKLGKERDGTWQNQESF